MRRELIVIALFSYLFSPLSAQQTDSIALIDTSKRDVSLMEPRIDEVDTIAPSVRKNFGLTVRRSLLGLKQNYPNPRTAAFAGLVFPGGGQLYNGDYWKVPLVWGGYAGVTYLIIQNTTNYRDFRNAVLQRLNNEPDAFPQFSLPGLRQQRDFYRKNLERAYIGMFALHVLSALEAFVACHLDLFDISDDLSLKLDVQPSPAAGIPLPGFPSVGVRYTLK
jgi:hypothetical protein